MHSFEVTGYVVSHGVRQWLSEVSHLLANDSIDD